MGKFFNIAGPCNPVDHYMLPASARLPDVMRLVNDKTYFVVHAQRQCGKTTAFQALVDEINEKGERVALYCSVEMALGKGALDLGVKFRGATYPVEVKLLYNFEKSHDKAYEQVARYIDHLGQNDGWLVIFDPDMAKPWEDKLSTSEAELNGKRIHVFHC